MTSPLITPALPAVVCMLFLARHSAAMLRLVRALLFGNTMAIIRLVAFYVPRYAMTDS